MMIGKVTVSTETYDSFCHEIRRRVPDVSEDRLYHEWTLDVNRQQSWSHDRIANRIRTFTPKRLYRDSYARKAPQ